MPALFSLYVLEASAQRITTVQGRVKSLSGEPLAGVSVTATGLKQGTSTDDQGFFSLPLSTGTFILNFSLLGFVSQQKRVNVSRRIALEIVLTPSQLQTSEITVTARRARNQVKDLRVGVQTIDMKTLQKLPSFLGEVDIIRSILSLPGVSTVGEGATGFNVRGGGIDQNLVLMDGQQLFNSSHLFGFFSVFNPEAVTDATLIKGGIPAFYGGRLSSILDVKVKSGGDSIEGSGGLGSVSSRIALGGPIVKGKSSFELSARRSYADLFLKLSNDSTIKKTYAYFYDLNGKASFTLGINDRLQVAVYHGRDVVNFAGQFGFDYGSSLGGLTYNHTFSPRFSVETVVGASNYDNTLGIPAGSNAFDYKTGILNTNVTSNFTLKLDTSNILKFGASVNRYDVSPGKFRPVSSTSFFNTVSVKHQLAYEYGLYASNSQQLTSSFAVDYGLRLSSFSYTASGQDSIFSYAGVTGTSRLPVDGRLYSKGQLIKNYTNLEPRITFRYLLDASSSLKGSYNRTSQYLHLISNTNAASPFDIWAVTTNNVLPEKADQWSLGYFKNFVGYETSFELYYKRLKNQIDYVNGAETLLNRNLEGELLYGTGRAYGAEFYLKKTSGKLTGWASYTLGRTERNFSSVNNGNWYPAKYDHTHSLSVVAVYDYSKRVTFGADFTFQTGVVTTFPDSRFIIDGLVVPYNSQGSRNNYRLPPYHRLDLSATLNNRRKQAHRFHSNWVLSLYNVYGRRNPYTIYFQTSKTNNSVTEAVRLSILGSVIPGVTWNFFF